MAISFNALNSACLSAFGSTFTYTHISTGAEEDIQAVQESPSNEQDVTPGEYLILFVDATAVVPEKGDFVNIADSVWTAFKIIPDQAGGARVFFERTNRA